MFIGSFVPSDPKARFAPGACPVGFPDLNPPNPPPFEAGPVLADACPLGLPRATNPFEAGAGCGKGAGACPCCGKGTGAVRGLSKVVWRRRRSSILRTRSRRRRSSLRTSKARSRGMETIATTKRIRRCHGSGSGKRRRHGGSPTNGNTGTAALSLRGAVTIRLIVCGQE